MRNLLCLFLLSFITNPILARSLDTLHLVFAKGENFMASIIKHTGTLLDARLSDYSGTLICDLPGQISAQKAEVQYVKGQPIGDWLIFYQGQVVQRLSVRYATNLTMVRRYNKQYLEKEYYINNHTLEIDSIAKEWHLNGKIADVAHYKNGTICGERLSWDTSGVLIFSCNYCCSDTQGYCSCIIANSTFKEIDQLLYDSWDNQGKILTQVLFDRYDKDVIYFVTYNEDGTVASFSKLQKEYNEAYGAYLFE